MRYLSPGQWQEWQRTGKKPHNISSTCYFCYLWLVHFLVDENIRQGNRSTKVYPLFYNPVDRPGAYNRAAIRPAVEGYTNGYADKSPSPLTPLHSLTRPLRFFTPNQLVPCMRKVRRQLTDPLTGQTRLEEVTVRAFMEDDSLLFHRGDAQPSALAHHALQPPSYTMSRVAPVSSVEVLRDELLDRDRPGVMPDARVDLRPSLTIPAAALAVAVPHLPDGNIIAQLRRQQLAMKELVAVKLESGKE
jgi:hypothetical protein